MFEEHAERTGQVFEREDPMPFFLHNVLGIDTGTGHKLRVPLAVDADGSVALRHRSARRAHGLAHERQHGRRGGRGGGQRPDARLRSSGGHEPAVALFFDCVATRLRMGKDFGFELDAVRGALGGAPFAGCNSIGQIARARRSSSAASTTAPPSSA